MDSEFRADAGPQGYFTQAIARPTTSQLRERPSQGPECACPLGSVSVPLASASLDFHFPLAYAFLQLLSWIILKRNLSTPNLTHSSRRL